MSLKKTSKAIKNRHPCCFHCLAKKETPLSAKILAGITVAYALSPIDLIPDFIPVLGHLDDVILLPVLVALTIKLIPQEVFSECRKESKGLWSDGKPKKWYYAIPIVLFWMLTVLVIVKAIWF